MAITFQAQWVKTLALEAGFNLVGITSAAASPRLDAYERWIERQMYGSMGYMARADRVVRRRDPQVILPGVRSFIVVGMDYHALNIPTEILADPSRGRIAAYAWGGDYHDILTPRLEALAERLRTAGGGTGVSHRVYVDTGAILERSHGQQAGLGFVGKNTMLINPRGGSYFFLGEILSDAMFDQYDQPHTETMCGRCTRCQPACPTAAFPQPYVLDARRCISYLTIEHKGSIDREFRPRLGNWIYGCDICQDVCPFTRFATPATEKAFWPPDLERAAPRLVDLLRINDQQFAAKFGRSPIARIKRERMVRNACVAAGNWGSDEAVPLLLPLLADPSQLIRRHAAWALGQIARNKNLGHESAVSILSALSSALAREPDGLVVEELQFALN